MRICRPAPVLITAILGLACVISAAAQSPATIRRVVVFPSGDGVKVEIVASSPVTPQAQVITGPDRLILDFPNSTPGLDLRNITVNRNQVKGLRVSLFTRNPPVTRVVVDLDSPQPYEIFPTGSTVVLKLNSKGVQAAASPQPTPPVVQPTAKAAASATMPPAMHSAAPVAMARVVPPTTTAPATVQPAPVVPALPPPPRMSVDFKNGKLKIFSDRASLAEVLAEVRRRTGADIGIPAGASQEQVFGTLGPGAPRDVMAALLNGSHFNFVMVGTDRDPTQLRSVLLTPRDGAPLSVPATTEPQQPAVVDSQPDPNEAAGAPEAPAIVDDTPAPENAEPTPPENQAENGDNPQAEPDMAPRRHHRRSPEDQTPPQQ